MKSQNLRITLFAIFLTTSTTFAWKYPETGLDAQRITYDKNMTWNTASGFVDFVGELTIEQGSATLGITIPFSEDIYFKDNALLTLDNKLELEANSKIKIDNHGFIYGEGNDIQLHGNLTIPSNKALEFLSDTIIDGNNNELVLSDDSQLIIDSDVTVTLKNLRLKTSTNSTQTPVIKTYLNSNLCLQNVEFDLGDKFTFLNGNIFITDDVKLIGSSEFVYSSTQHLFINKDSIFTIDFDSKFTYSPYNNDRDLIVMKDVTSKICLNGCTFASTYTGMRLTKGKLIIDNHVTFSTIISHSIAQTNQFIFEDPIFTDSRTIFSNNYTGTEGYSVAFSPDGTLLAAGGSNGTIEIHYTGTDGSLNRAHVISSSSLNQVNAVAISNNGKWLAAGGNNSSIEIYEIENDASLNLEGTTTFTGIYINDLKFSTLDDFLAIGGYNNSGNNIEIFALTPDGSLVELDSKSIGTEIFTVSFSQDETLLSAAGDGGLEIYGIAVNGDLTSFNTLATPTRCRLAANGRFLAVEFSGDLRIYEIDSSGNLIYLSTFSPSLTSIKDLNFSPDSNFVVIGGANAGGDEIEVCYVGSDGLLTLKETKNYSGSGQVESVAFSPDNYLIAATGVDTTNAPIEIHPFILDYNTNYHQTYNWTAFTPKPTSKNDNGITFGNSALGASHNLLISILGGTKLDIQGILNFDNVK